MVMNNDKTTKRSSGEIIIDGFYLMHYVYHEMVELVGEDEAEWWLAEMNHLAVMGEEQFKNKLDQISPCYRCKAEIDDGRLTVCRVGRWADFYLFFDEENTDKLQKLLGGSIAINLHKYFSDDDSFEVLREYCNANEIQYRYDTWSSGD